jgi:hypothetical protein
MHIHSLAEPGLARNNQQAGDGNEHLTRLLSRPLIYMDFYTALLTRAGLLLHAAWINLPILVDMCR